MCKVGVLNTTPLARKIITRVDLYRYLERSSSSLQHLNQIHAQMLVNGFNKETNNNSLTTKFITTLFSSGEPHLASLVFNQLESPNVFLWTCMIRGFSYNGGFKESILFYDRMRRQGVRPSNFSFPFALKSCAAVEALFEGEEIHADALKLGFVSDVFIQTALLDMYMKCRRIEAAEKVFDEMGERNVVFWTAIISGYCRFGLLEQAQELFEEMPTKNAVTWNVMIDGLARCGALEAARQLFDKMPVRNIVSWTTMICGYSRKGDMANARLLFDQMPEREVVAWTSLISGYAQNGEPGQAIKVFEMMLAAGMKPDGVTMLGVISAVSQLGSLHLCAWIEDCISRCGFEADVRILNAVINMYVQCGCIGRALRAFEKITEKDIVSYNSMITGCATHGYTNGALSVFSQMIKMEVKPNGITFAGLLTVCAHGGLVEEGRRYFRRMFDLGHVKITAKHYACMVDLLGRAGHLEEAYEVVLGMPIKPEASTWGALLGACRMHGNLSLAEVAAQRLFEMEPENPGNYTILANMYMERRMWDAAMGVRQLMKGNQIYKTAGTSWVEVTD